MARDLCCMACGGYKAIGFFEVVMGAAMGDSQAAGAELDEMASATQQQRHSHSRWGAQGRGTGYYYSMIQLRVQ